MKSWPIKKKGLIMKKIAMCLVAVAVCGFILTGCKSTNTSDGGSMNIYPQTVGPVDAYRPLYKVNEKQKVDGEAKINVLFGIFTWGDTTNFADNSSLFGNAWYAAFCSKEMAGKAAFYNACIAANCDAIVAARYVINTTDYFVFKTMKVKVTGFPAVMTGVETVKPMPYYVNGKGEVVVLDKLVTPHLLFDVSADTCILF